MKKSLLFLLALGVAFLPLNAFATSVLFERTMNVNRSVNIFDTDEFDVDLTLGDHFFAPANPVTLFDDLLVTPDDVGTVFSISTGDAALDEAAERLTDAEDEFVRLIFAENQPDGLSEERGWSESHFFLGHASPAHPDLAGATIEQIRLSVDGFDLVGGTTGMLATGIVGPPVNLQLTVQIYGTAVPEPSGIWLLGSGFATLLGIRHRRWRHSHWCRGRWGSGRWGSLVPARVTVLSQKHNSR